LCTAWANAKGQGIHKQQAVAFRNLAAAAGGASKVASYCAAIPHPGASSPRLAHPAATPHRSGKPSGLPTPHGSGKPSSLPTPHGSGRPSSLPTRNGSGKPSGLPTRHDSADRTAHA
jgi:hypothetical protein